MSSHEYGPWCVAAKRNPQAKVRLACFPYAGASASIFGCWHRYFRDDIELWGIQLPGRQNRISESPFTRIHPLLMELAGAITPLLDRPFAFFGHSMGAILAFEMARFLRRRSNLAPKALFVSGRRAPQIPDTDPPLHSMDDAMFLAEIRRLKGTPEEVLNNSDILQLVLPALRADTQLCDTYEYTEDTMLSCSITAFCGTEDKEENTERMKAWKTQTTGDFSLCPLVGDHFFIHSNEKRIIELLQVKLLEEM
jgi:medium-chain acyl-[acyl-carrier-protein] hydrolase